MSQNNKRVKTIGLVAIGAWGALHLVAGAMLLAGATDTEGVRDALSTLGSAVSVGDGEIGDATASVVRFHAFNLAWIGAVVFAIAIVMRRRFELPLIAATTALVIFADLGLTAFMLAPGVMEPTDGLPGIVLAAVGLPAIWAAYAKGDSRHELATRMST